MTLLERLRKSRETNVEAGGYTFTLRRPTGLQISEDGAQPRAMLRRALVGWTVPECEVVPGGGGEAAPWDLDAAMEWLEDRPVLYNELFSALGAVIERYLDALHDTEKK